MLTPLRSEGIVGGPEGVTFPARHSFSKDPYYAYIAEIVQTLKIVWNYGSIFPPNTPLHDPVPRVRGRSLGFKIHPVTTIKNKTLSTGTGYGVVPRDILVEICCHGWIFSAR